MTLFYAADIRYITDTIYINNGYPVQYTKYIQSTSTDGRYDIDIQHIIRDIEQGITPKLLKTFLYQLILLGKPDNAIVADIEAAESFLQREGDVI